MATLTSLVVRFPRSRDVERQQLKWATYAAVVGVGLFLSGNLLTRLPFVSWAIVWTIAATLFPIAVVGLGAALRAVAGGAGGDVVAASTLLVAAAFGPVRRRVRSAVDRRFNRARYDARQTVEALANRLRDETDLDSLILDVEQAVVGALGPRALSLWVASPGADTQWAVRDP